MPRCCHLVLKTRPGAEASTDDHHIGVHSFPPCCQVKWCQLTGLECHKSLVAKLQVWSCIGPCWSLTLVLSLGLLRKGPPAEQTCTVGKALWKGPWATLNRRCQAPLQREIPLLCALIPWGCLWSSFLSLSVSE